MENNKRKFDYETANDRDKESLGEVLAKVLQIVLGAIMAILHM